VSRRLCNPVEEVADNTFHPLNGLASWNLHTYRGLGCPAGCLSLRTSVSRPSICLGRCWAGVRLGLSLLGALASPRALSRGRRHAQALPNFIERMRISVPDGYSPRAILRDRSRDSLVGNFSPRELTYPYIRLSSLISENQFS
jgi:hypothetical protein